MAEDLLSLVVRLETARCSGVLYLHSDPASEVLALVREPGRHQKAGLLGRVGRTKLSLEANAPGTRKTVALSVEANKVNLAWREWLRRRIEPILIDSGPAQEAVHTGANGDLTRPPLVAHATTDGEPYITAGTVFVARDPDPGQCNNSFNRKQSQKAGLQTTLSQELE